MLRSVTRCATAAAFALLLASCGGGGSGGGTSPPPPPPPPPPPGGGNSPPVFTSAATASVQENVTGVVYTATATDPNGQALTFSISGGADAADFSITAAGALSFVVSPDFEAPADANGDNVYQVTLSVSDGQASATLTLTVTVTNRTGTLRVRRVGASLSQPLFVTGLTDGSGRVYVVQKGGSILILNPATGITEATPFINLSSQISTDGERGLLGFALAPDFATSRTFYVYLTNPAGDIELRRYRTQTANPNVADTTTADLILAIDHPAESNHNGGWISFGPDGNLYVATGDGAANPSTAQSTTSLLGKILRIDVRSDQFPADANRDYAIPAGNPFATAGGSPEIWVLGLRNPFRAGFDSVTGDLFIGDVGQSAREEINRVRQTGGGSNFGWPFFEGTLTFQGTPPAGFAHALPVTEYARGSGPNQGETVIGGYVYRGPVDSLRGQYVFGDFIDGHVWTVPETSLTIGSTLASSQYTLRDAEFAPDFGSINSLASFGLDPAGNLYIVDIDGEVFRVEASE